MQSQVRKKRYTDSDSARSGVGTACSMCYFYSVLCMYVCIMYSKYSSGTVVLSYGCLCFCGLSFVASYELCTVLNLSVVFCPSFTTPGQAQPCLPFPNDVFASSLPLYTFSHGTLRGTQDIHHLVREIISIPPAFPPSPSLPQPLSPLAPYTCARKTALTLRTQ